MKKQRGFTTIELLLATVVLVIGLIGGSSFFYANRRNLVAARFTRLATWSAISRMESLKAGDYASTGNTTESVTLDGDTATRTTTVDVPYAVALKRVVVTVSGTGGNVSLTTYIAQQ